MVGTRKIYRIPKKAKRDEILALQNNRCYWCDREFETSVVSPSNTLYVLHPQWDHYIPFSYTNKNDDDQFVASCIRCNCHKSSYIITSSEKEEELRKYLKIRWYHGGWKEIEDFIREQKELKEALYDE